LHGFKIYASSIHLHGFKIYGKCMLDVYIWNHVNVC
jgi:hypothetical protein